MSLWYLNHGRSLSPLPFPIQRDRNSSPGQCSWGRRAPSPASQLMAAASFQEAQHFLPFNPSYVLQGLDSRQVWPRVWGSILPPRSPQMEALLKDGTVKTPGPLHRLRVTARKSRLGRLKATALTLRPPPKTRVSLRRGPLPLPPSPHDPDRNHTT